MFNSIKNQLRSVIEWKPTSADLFLEKWSSNSDEIKNSSQLIVGPGQGCFFVYEGKIQAVHLTQGVFELKTDNIPFFTTLNKFMQAFESEHKVGIYFFKQTEIVNLGWGTTSPVKYEDPKFKFPVGLRAFGNFSIQIAKAEFFFTNFIGLTDALSVDSLQSMFASRFMQPLTDLLAESKLTVTDIDSNRNELAQQFIESTKSDFSRFGFNLKDFRIEGTSFDDDTMKRINRIADMTAESQAAQAVGLTFQQIQQLEALKLAAKNEGGGAGLGMGLGAGLGLGQQLAQSFGGFGAAASGSDDPTVRLKKLKDLFDQKLISLEEFEAKKREILAKL